MQICIVRRLVWVRLVSVPVIVVVLAGVAVILRILILCLVTSESILGL